MLDAREYQEDPPAVVAPPPEAVILDTPAAGHGSRTVGRPRSGRSGDSRDPSRRRGPRRDRRGPTLRDRLRRLRGAAALCGPAFVVSVAYVDPGNFATNMSGGARYGYLLLWVIAVANLLAMFVQALSAKLGIATGRSLPELCRDHLPRGLTVLLWAQGELVAVATDLAEFIGGAVALNLLFGVPLLPGAAITAAVSFALLGLAPHGRHRFETVIAGMLVVVLVGFVYQSLRAGSFAGAERGLVPRLVGPDSLLVATGILGATVMPHVVYLHSALTRHQCGAGGVGGTDGAGGHGGSARGRAALRSSRIDILIALGVAGLVNMAMLAVAAVVFRGSDPGGLRTIHSELGRLLGPGAAVAFGVALLASGLASSSVGTYAGQVIMEGFLRRRVPLAARRAITMAPAFAILAAGVEPTRALILSQVVLSFGIPFALVPLIALTSRKRLMGAFVNRRRTVAAGVAVTGVITALNGYLVVQAVVT